MCYSLSFVGLRFCTWTCTIGYYLSSAAVAPAYTEESMPVPIMTDIRISQHWISVNWILLPLYLWYLIFSYFCEFKTRGWEFHNAGNLSAQLISLFFRSVWSYYRSLQHVTILFFCSGRSLFNSNTERHSCLYTLLIWNSKIGGKKETTWLWILLGKK